jgi:hypothetical protein
MPPAPDPTIDKIQPNESKMLKNTFALIVALYLSLTFGLPVAGSPNPPGTTPPPPTTPKADPAASPIQLATPPPNPAVEKAEMILKKSLDAYGGEDAILAIQNASYEYQVQTAEGSEGKPVKTKSMFQGETQFRSEVNQDGQSVITVLNDDKAWTVVAGTLIPVDRRALLALKTSLVIKFRPELLLLSFPKHRFTLRTQEGQRTLDLIDVSGFLEGEYLRGRLSIDAANNLVFRFEYELEREFPQGKGIVRGEEQYLSYQLIEKKQVPLVIVSKQGAQNSQLTVQTARFNTTLDSSLFAMPEKK